MNKKREYPPCVASDCFANSLNKCKVLNNTDFRGGVPVLQTQGHCGLETDRGEHKKI